MRSETFYSTVAQMLPALLIALAVEFVEVRRAVQKAAHAPSPEELERMYASDNPPINVPVIMTALAGILAFFGELCAVLVSLFGTDGWFPIVAGPFCAIAVLVMTLLVAWILWAHLAQPRV